MIESIRVLVEAGATPAEAARAAVVLDAGGTIAEAREAMRQLAVEVFEPELLLESARATA